MMSPTVIGIIIIAILLLLSSGYWWFSAGKSSGGSPATTVVTPTVVTPTVVATPVYTAISKGTSETADTPAIPGTTIIKATDGSQTIQYGQETPVSSVDEHFQPYMSVLTNDMYRSDAAFDSPLGRGEPEIHGNYNDW